MNDAYIRVENIVKEYPGVMALDRVSFIVTKGSIHGFLGPNGAGKSTTLSIIVGLFPPTSGKVFIKGLQRSQNQKQIGSMIGFLPENPPLYGYMRVRDFLSFVGRIHNLSKGESLIQADSLIELCGLQVVKSRMINNLSKGFKQRIGIAQTLVYNPEIIILDEPSVGLDPNSLMEIRDLILSLKENHTILLSSHQLGEVDLLCSDITIINAGKIVASGPKDAIAKDLQGKQIIDVEVVNWSEDLAREFEREFDVERLEMKKETDIFKMKIFLKTNKDLRGEISGFLVKRNCNLLSIKRMVMNLEDIFKETVRDKR